MTQINCWLTDRCNHKDCDKPSCLRRYKLGKLYELARLSPKQSVKLTLFADQDGTDVDQFRYLANIESKITTFVSDPLHNNLYLHSTQCGNGKSSWAIRLMQAYLSKIWFNSELVPRALFVSVPRFLESLKLNIDGFDEYAMYVIKYVANADLVVWDDIAAKTGTDYEINKLLSFIESRICAGKANIFTSNLSTEAMELALGERLASRICRGSIDVELHGSDKRPLIFKTK